MIGLIKKIKFDNKADRLGPDCPFSHWRLFFKKTMQKLCDKKFEHFGKDAEFRPYAFAINCSKISIGDKVVIRPGSMLFADVRDPNKGRIIIEDQVLVGSGVHIYVSNHKFGEFNNPIIDQGHFDAIDTKIKTGAWIGANCILLPGVTVGKNSIVGAGSIVTKDVPDNTVVAGNPARILKSLS
ncbi:acyltransferase [Arenibacter sp. BSSL-BM3]|uniref:Acyltransferase n=1 Tax=Arenibacter arenosicollis TaxID=2762274 RepID=A0ABR7QIE0_9FLAO|nr:acyltransferase [Arenibacter arenosicollis]MBC8766914.1 acyltransferase [Arenibacter arenosicollis]